MLLVLTIVFVMIRVAPGDPAVAVLGTYASEEALTQVKHEMGIDRPLYVQYFEFLVGFATFDFGRSMINNSPIGAQIRYVLPKTLILTLSGIFIGCLIGIPIGIWTALKRNTLSDYVGRTISMAGLSVPSFLLAILLVYMFAVRIPIFPSLGVEDAKTIWDHLYHLTLPALSLGLIMAAYMSRMTRSTMLNILNLDYVRTAKAKGLPRRAVIYDHAMKNALIPIVTVIGMYVGVLIADSVLIEIVFSRPGLGKLMVSAMMKLDYNMLQTVLGLYAGIIVLANLLTDLTYAWLDPRIKYK